MTGNGVFMLPQQMEACFPEWFSYYLGFLGCIGPGDALLLHY